MHLLQTFVWSGKLYIAADLLLRFWDTTGSNQPQQRREFAPPLLPVVPATTQPRNPVTSSISSRFPARKRQQRSFFSSPALHCCYRLPSSFFPVILLLLISLSVLRTSSIRDRTAGGLSRVSLHPRQSFTLTAEVAVSRQRQDHPTPGPSSSHSLAFSGEDSPLPPSSPTKPVQQPKEHRLALSFSAVKAFPAIFFSLFCGCCAPATHTGCRSSPFPVSIRLVVVFQKIQADRSRATAPFLPCHGC